MILMTFLVRLRHYLAGLSCNAPWAWKSRDRSTPEAEIAAKYQLCVDMNDSICMHRCLAGLPSFPIFRSTKRNQEDKRSYESIKLDPLSINTLEIDGLESLHRLERPLTWLLFPRAWRRGHHRHYYEAHKLLIRGFSHSDRNACIAPS